MLAAVMNDLSSAAGIEQIADLGVVHTGVVGVQECEVSLRVERWHGAYYLCIRVVLSHGSSFRRTRVVKWPYSRADRRDLTAALVDLQVVRAGPRPGVFVDERTTAGRMLDALTRRRVHGTYTFHSPILADQVIDVCAEIVDVGGQRTVALTESTPRRGHVLAHLPHAAFAGLCAALERYAAIV